MMILKDVLVELLDMFLGDMRLSATILLIVVIAAGVIDVAGAPPLLGGALLLVGCLAVTIGAVLSAARAHAKASGSAIGRG